MNSKWWNIFNHVLVTGASIAIYQGGYPYIAISYLSWYILAQVLRIRQEFLREQKIQIMLDVLSRIEICSPEELESLQIAMPQGMVTAHECEIALRRSCSSAKMSHTLKECQQCRFWHGKNDIVCAVHPLGYQGDSCLDYCLENNGAGLVEAATKRVTGFLRFLPLICVFN